MTPPRKPPSNAAGLTPATVVLYGVVLLAAVIGFARLQSIGDREARHFRAQQIQNRDQQAQNHRLAAQANRTAATANRRVKVVLRYIAGKQGVPGLPGLNGLGTPGRPGLPGVGQRGLQGPQGLSITGPPGASVTGPQGDQGRPGQNATDEQIDARLAAYCAAHNSCTGPQGPPGKDGAPGPPTPPATSAMCTPNITPPGTFTCTFS